jgi:tripartite-type tricarboxylate transporter receptor subunit TctC
MFAQHFQAKYGVSVIIENKGGAGGSIGSAFVAKAPPDGYTLVLGTVSTHAINPALYAKLPFNVETDFEPISPIVRLPNLLVINNKLPVRTVAELVAYLKAMVGGHIDVAIDSMTTIWPIAKAGDVRPLAVTTPRRVATAPDLPTIGETVTGFEAIGWQGLFAPAGTPRPIVEELAAEVKRIFLQPELVTALQNVGGEPLPMSPDEFARFARSERVKWGAVVKEANLRIE